MADLMGILAKGFDVSNELNEIKYENAERITTPLNSQIYDIKTMSMEQYRAAINKSSSLEFMPTVMEPLAEAKPIAEVANIEKKSMCLEHNETSLIKLFAEGVHFEQIKKEFTQEKAGDANCYAAAFKLDKNPLTGEKFYERPQPGEFAGKEFPEYALQYENNDYLLEKEITDNVAADCKVIGYTFEKVENGNHIPDDGNWLVALACGKSHMTGIADYHWWWKEESSGIWYHKPGLESVEHFNGSGKMIFDPAECDRSNPFMTYDRFLGYYEVGKNNEI